jgi:hypothetical protein
LNKRFNARRFWARVNVGASDQCWIWQGPVFAHGYGQYSNNQAHRVAWCLANGRVPEFNILHRCDTPLCCNPEHLFEGTQLDNVRDMIVKGRNVPLPSLPGESNPASKLMQADVNSIRQLRAEGWTIKRLAAQFRMGTTTIGNIIHRRIWP